MGYEHSPCINHLQETCEIIFLLLFAFLKQATNERIGILVPDKVDFIRLNPYLVNILNLAFCNPLAGNKSVIVSHDKEYRLFRRRQNGLKLRFLFRYAFSSNLYGTKGNLSFGELSSSRF